MIKGKTINFAGTDYVMPPLNLASLEHFQDKLANYTGGIDRESVQFVVEVAHAALKRNYPDVTIDQLKDWIDLGNIQEVFSAVMNVSMLVPRDGQGEAEAPAQP